MLDLATVHQTLQHVLHLDDRIRKPSEDALKEYENIAGFVSILVQIISERTAIETQSRLMASICLKNMIQRHWKNRGRQHSHTVSDREKNQLRQFLLTHMDENEPQIATQLSVCVSKLARMDWPPQWPDLFPALLSYLQTGSTIQIYRAMYTLKRTLKELASRRLMMHKKAFYTMARELFPKLYHMWQAQASKCISMYPNVTPIDFDLFHHSTKVLFHLIVTGFQGLGHDNPLLLECFQVIHAHIQSVLKLPPPLDKTLVALARIVVDCQKQHPIECRAVLLPYLDLFYSQLIVPQSSKRFLIQAVQFISNVSNCQLYRHSATTGKKSVITASSGDVTIEPEMMQQIRHQLESFMTVSRKEELTRVLVLHLMQLDPTELEDWQADPEGFIVTQESLTATESVRSAAENLFLTLLQSNRDLLAPIVIQMLEQHGVSSEAARLTRMTPDEILRADAVLLAIGLASYDLYDCVDFEPWFLTTLVPCLQTTTQMPPVLPVPVLRRRIVWVIGCWMAQITDAVRAPLYDALLGLLSEDSPYTDMAVKVSALQTIQALLDDWEFKRALFEPFIGRLIQAAFHMIRQTGQAETRLKVMEVLQSMLSVCDDAVLPHTESLVSPLPELWQLAQDQNLLRGQILRVISKLVTAVRSFSVQLHPLLLPVLQYSTDVAQPDQIYLMDAGLDLWLELVQYSTHLTPDLLMLFQNIPKCIAKDFEHIKSAFKLIQSYLLLSHEAFWSSYAHDLCHIFDLVIGNLKPDGAAFLSKVLEFIIRLFPTEAALAPLHHVFQRLLGAIVVSSRNDHANREPDMVIIGYMSVLARLSFHVPQLFYTVIVQSSQSSPGCGLSPVELLDFYLTKYYSIVYGSVGPIRRTLWACTMCGFLIHSPMDTIERLGQILQVCVDVLDSTNDDDKAEKAATACNTDGMEEDEAKRRAQIFATDPIRVLNLHQYVVDRVTDCSRRIDPDVFDQAVQLTEKSVLCRFTTPATTA